MSPVNQTASDSCEEETLDNFSHLSESSDSEHKSQVSVATQASTDSGAESSSPSNSGSSQKTSDCGHMSPPNSATSQKFSDCSHESLSPPNSANSVTPPSSVDSTSSTSQDGDSKQSSRTTSSEIAPSVLERSSSRDEKLVSYAVAKINGAKFTYLRISSNCVPKGWTNDPSRLLVVAKEFNAGDYTLQGSTPVLASDSGNGHTRYMISISRKLYFWTPGSDDLLYVTERYSLSRILRCMDSGSSELQTKPLKPLSQHSPPDQLLFGSLWFWQVPTGWSQDMNDLDYLQEVVGGCYEYGLPLSVPLLVSDGRSGSTEFLLKSGEEYYLFFVISSDLVHIDEPKGLYNILRALSTKPYTGLVTTLVDVLPEYGGPDFVAENDVPNGWSNDVKKVWCSDAFCKKGIFVAKPLLVQSSSLIDNPLYLVQAQSEKHYIWKSATNEISRIDRAEGLQDILDILDDPSRHLSLSRIEPEQ